MIRFLPFLIGFLLCSTAFSQPGVSPVKTVNGKEFYVHRVEAGNTLYGLQRIYGVSVEEIVQANGVELNAGLKVGQEVLIPLKKTVQVEQKTSPYTVQKEETLYGISRKFNTTVDELIRLNPEAENGIRKGQVLRIPGEFVQEIEEEEVPTPNPFVVEDKGDEKVLFNFNDSIVEHTVLAHETMYSISKRFMISIEELMEFNGLRSTTLSVGQVLRIPIKQERTEKVIIKEVPLVKDPSITNPPPVVKKERYKIIVMAPFYLDFGKGYSEYVSNMATHFYMGAQMAIDSLRAKGLKADVHFVDTKGDSTTVAELLKGSDFKNVDAIIGPFFPKTQKLVAEFCGKNKVKMISPVNLDESLVNHEYIYSAVPSDAELMRQTADFLLRTEKKANIVLIQVTKESDKLLFESFKNYYNSKVSSMGGTTLKESSIDNLKNYIVRGTKTIFVVPANDKNTALKFMNSLNRSAFRSTADDIAVYGTKDWMNFSDVNGVHRDKYNFHFASTTFLNYDDDYTIEANRKFRRKYNTDLSRMAAQGYDIMLYTGMHFFLQKEPKNLLMNDVQFVSSGEGKGYVNKKVYMLEQEDYQIIDSELPKINGSK